MSGDGIFLARPETIGPGIPFAVKDLFDTAGLATTYGSGIFAEHVPSETAPAVAARRPTLYTHPRCPRFRSGPMRVTSRPAASRAREEKTNGIKSRAESQARCARKVRSAAY